MFSLTGLLYLTLILSLASSLNHVAYAFSTVNNGSMIIGYGTGLAIDLGLLVLAASINHRKKQQKRTNMLWGGVFLFSAISIYANWLSGVVHLQTIEVATNQMGSFLIGLRPILLSGVLPILVIYLSEVLSSEYQNNVAKESARIKRAQSKTKKLGKGKLVAGIKSAQKETVSV